MKTGKRFMFMGVVEGAKRDSEDGFRENKLQRTVSFCGKNIEGVGLIFILIKYFVPIWCIHRHFKYGLVVKGLTSLMLYKII